jgi:hypothetical protein
VRRETWFRSDRAAMVCELSKKVEALLLLQTGNTQQRERERERETTI